jgi:hypothetical protein
MTYLNQGAEVSIPSTYNENIFILPVTYSVIKKNLLSFNGQYGYLSSFDTYIICMYKYFFNAKTYRTHSKIFKKLKSPHAKIFPCKFSFIS